MISRVCLGYGNSDRIPIWVGIHFNLWEFHMWESYGKSSFPHVGILWEIVIPICGNPMGIPTEILWEWDGNGNENSLPTATLVSLDE